MYGFRYGYGLPFEYKSSLSIGGWPLIHIAGGVDPKTMQLRAAKGIIAIGNIAIGGLAIGGVALGLISVGGVSLGLLLAIGGVALGAGCSIGGVAVGAVAIGGFAVGYIFSMGGLAFGPAGIDAVHCAPAARDIAAQWLNGIPRICR
jgi:hypothetical protein